MAKGKQSLILVVNVPRSQIITGATIAKYTGSFK
jgi:hypothetical protein